MESMGLNYNDFDLDFDFEINAKRPHIAVVRAQHIFSIIVQL
jgi:hypothetical protein